MGKADFLRYNWKSALLLYIFTPQWGLSHKNGWNLSTDRFHGKMGRAHREGTCLEEDRTSQDQNEEGFKLKDWNLQLL
jgi:hypothetical protein